MTDAIGVRGLYKSIDGVHDNTVCMWMITVVWGSGLYILGSYTYCTTCYRAPDAVYTAYGLLKPSVHGLYTNPHSGCTIMWFASE